MYLISLKSLVIKICQLLCLLFGIFELSSAVTEENPLPAQISADSAIYKHQIGEDVFTYFGHAQFTQGNTNLSSPEIAIYKTKDKLNKITATGAGSSYNTVDNKQQLLNAQADLITIDFKKNLLQLKEHGQLVMKNSPEQNNVMLQGDEITVYKNKQDVTKVVVLGENSSYQNGNQQQPLSATANSISIMPKKATMILDGKASLIIGKDQYSGPHINYKYE